MLAASELFDGAYGVILLLPFVAVPSPPPGAPLGTPTRKEIILDHSYFIIFCPHRSVVSIDAQARRAAFGRHCPSEEGHQLFKCIRCIEA